MSVGIFDVLLPTVTTIASGQMFRTLDIAIDNEASLTIGSQFAIRLTAVRLHTG